MSKFGRSGCWLVYVLGVAPIAWQAAALPKPSAAAAETAPKLNLGPQLPTFQQRRPSSPAPKPNTPAARPGREGTVSPQTRITPSPPVAPPPAVLRRESPPGSPPPGPVVCNIFQAPRPRGRERSEVLRALATVDRNVFTRPGGAALRRAFPFAELQSLASVPLEARGASQRRLGEMLATLNAMSLDAAYAPTVRDASVANLHERLRQFVDASQAGAPSPPPPAPANDLAATELYGTLDNWKSARWIVRVHVVACADDDGQRKSSITKAQVQQGIEMADKVFEPAHLRFAFDPAKDWEELQNTKINRWDIVDHDANARAFATKASLQGKVVLFSAWGPDPATARAGAANGGTHIWLPTDGFDPSGLCHEMGHFLGRLYHTFPGDGSELVYGTDPTKITAATVDGIIADFIYDTSRNTSGTTTEQALDGDGFSDTPPDPGCNYWGAKWPGMVCDPGFPTATVPNPKGGPAWVFTPDRANLLSYFFRCPALPTLTSQQAAAILGRLEGTVPQGDNQDLKRLIAGQIPGSASSGQFIIVGKVRNVGSATSTGGRTAVLESVGDAQTPNAPMGPPVPIGPLAPNDWVLVKVPMPDGLAWTGKACLKISPGDANPANDTLCPAPLQGPAGQVTPWDAGCHWRLASAPLLSSQRLCASARYPTSPPAPLRVLSPHSISVSSAFHPWPLIPPSAARPDLFVHSFPRLPCTSPLAELSPGCQSWTVRRHSRSRGGWVLRVQSHQ
ncbi:MAG: hypothetical protein ACYC6Y_06160 [Thermoguttaceae bacterium]